MRLLIAEGDVRVARAVRAALTRHGFHVTCVFTAAAAMRLLRTDPDLILLDVGLRDRDGLLVCQEIRRVSDVPIIMTTASSQIAARVAGLTQGADDYLVKPYNLAELVARIHAVSRRRSHRPSAGGPAGDEGPGRALLKAGQLRVDLDAWSAQIDGVPLPLTRKEFELLALLARQPGQVLPHQRLIDEVWPASRANGRRTLHVHMSSLRSKLNRRCSIETVHGVGYRLADPDPGRC